MQTLHQFQTSFNSYLREQIFQKDPAELYEPVDYIMGLGGKRLRPAVLLMSFYLFEDRYESALPAACAIEIFHNFTLLHDDIMDNAPLRRGQPTVHEKYDVNTGILSGDVMLVKAYDYLLRLEDQSKLPRLMQIFTKAGIEVCEGQQMDMNFENYHDISIPEYLKMIELKTSVLVAAAMKMGATLAGAPERACQHLYEFGRNLGISFQLQDDLLDTFGDPGKFGKKVGGDIVRNKKTYLFLKAMELASAEDRNRLRKLYSLEPGQEANKVAEVIEIFNRLKVRGFAQELQEDYRLKAFENLDQIEAPEERKDILKDFAFGLMAREA